MPKNCAVIKCHSKAGTSGRKFYRFPMLNNRSEWTLRLTQNRQDAWLEALNRSDFFPQNYKNATVCDLHFVTGRSASFTDVKNVDWVPTLHLGYDIKIEPPDRDGDKELQFNVNAINEDMKLEIDDDEYMKIEVEDDERIRFEADDDVTPNFEASDDEQSIEINDRQTQTDHYTMNVSTQTNDRITGVSANIVRSYQERLRFLEDMLRRKDAILEQFQASDKKTINKCDETKI